MLQRAIKILILLFTSLLVLTGCIKSYDIKTDEMNSMIVYKNVDNGVPIRSYIFGCDKSNFKLHANNNYDLFFSCDDEMYKSSYISRKIYAIGPSQNKIKKIFCIRSQGMIFLLAS